MFMPFVISKILLHLLKSFKTEHHYLILIVRVHQIVSLIKLIMFKTMYLLLLI